MKRHRSIALGIAATVLVPVLALSVSSPAGPARGPEHAGRVRSYLLIANRARLPRRIDLLVNRAGGKLVRKIPQIGIVVAESADPDFPSNAMANVPALRSVVPNIGLNWLDPVYEEVDPRQAAITNEQAVDEYFLPLQWPLDAIDAPEALATGATGAGVRVAVLDTGLYYEDALDPPIHPDLYPNVNVDLAASFVPDETPWNQAPTSPPWFVKGWHGTWVAGIIAAADSPDDFGTIGVAPEAEIVPVKVLRKETGYGLWSWVVAGIVYAADMDADVINMSLSGMIRRRGFLDDNGTADTSDDIWISARDVAEIVRALNLATSYARKQGATIIASAGNEKTDLDKDQDWLHLPAQAVHVIAVSATAPQLWALYPDTDLDMPASYSNYGRSVIGLAAPGGDSDMRWTPEGKTLVQIEPWPRAEQAWAYDMVLAPSPAIPALDILFNFRYASGTSAAAPHVAGVAALVIGLNGGSMNPARVEAILRASADEIAGPGKDAFYGHGRVNAYRAVTSVK